MSQINGMIFCAGLGTRLRPHTERIAKPVLSVLNVPMFNFPLFYLEALGIKNLVVNTHHRPESVRLAVRGATAKANYSVQILNEAPAILGSGGGLKNAESHLKSAEALICANGDAVAIFSDPRLFHQIVDDHMAQGALATLVLCPHPEAGKTLSAAWTDSQNGIQGFGLTAPTPTSRPWHYTGYLVLNPKIFNYLGAGESNLLHDGLMAALRDGQKIRGTVVESLLWFETGNEMDYLAAHRQLLNVLADDSSVMAPTLRAVMDRFTPGWGAVQPKRGIYLHKDSHINRAQLSPRTLIGANCVIHPEAQLSKSGFVVMGEQCEVREPCLLEDVVLLTGAVTQARGHLAQCIVSTMAM
jgi:mannose-1-phosphate guanylyltransferase